jgi:5-methylcytosine-specific restriction endonuclease McrA
MTATMALRTLVLNADFRPLSTWPPSLISGKDAVRAVFRDRVIVVEEWDAAFRSPSITINVPKVVALNTYAPVTSSPKFCRRSILLRDKFSCQYCGNRFTTDELTFDHVIPRSAGGQTVWSNILTACVECNSKKRDSMPNYSGRRGTSDKHGMRPLKEPRQPTAYELLQAGLEFIDAAILEDYGWWFGYWGAELRN